MSEDEKKSDDYFQVGVGVWLSFCVFMCVWFLSYFLRGRRQLHNNLHVIEDGLRRMQEEIERRQRENSIGYGQDLNKLTEEFINGKINNDEQKKEEEEAKKLLEENQKEEEDRQVLVSDKKKD